MYVSLGSSAAAWRWGSLHLLRCPSAKRCVGHQGPETGRTRCPFLLYWPWVRAQALRSPCWLITRPQPTQIHDFLTWRMACATSWTTPKGQVGRSLQASGTRSHNGKVKKRLLRWIQLGRYCRPLHRRKSRWWRKRRPKRQRSKGPIARGSSAGRNRTQERRMLGN